MKEDIASMTLPELTAAMAKLGQPKYRAGQIFRWLHKVGVRDFDEMTDLPRQLRADLSNNFVIFSCSIEKKLCSAYDNTVKYLFRLHDGEIIESVVMQYKYGYTVCVSSQVGCRMGCKFCASTLDGVVRNLTPSEILAQIYAAERDLSIRVSHVVMMGMGEPLDNYDAVMRVIEVLTSDWGFGWSPKRITLSTIGVLPNLRRYLDECKCHLAVSVHNPFPEERFSIMPVQKAWPLRDVVDLIRKYDFTGQRRVSFEYTMFAGFNDDRRHADALARLFSGLECRVNLIRFHKIPDFPYETSPDAVMERFRDRLSAHGVTTTIRSSRGEDILAACGLLAGKHKNVTNDE